MLEIKKSEDSFSDLVSFIEDKQLHNTLSLADQPSQNACHQSTKGVCLEESPEHVSEFV